MKFSRWGGVNAIYQVYPRSFQDSNDDGVGDIRGVIDRLDYFLGQKNSLGVDAIWFSPIFTSPMKDMGYDVSNYVDIDPLFGSLDDFRELLAKAHKLGLKVMLDFVPNHSSAEHPWFQESRTSRTNDMNDYYVWRDAKPDGSRPNNWTSIFGGPAWTWDEGRGQYYLHTFLSEQPDLNWDNPKVRSEMAEAVRFWLDLGVDGFRADAVRFVSKDPEFRDETAPSDWQAGREDDDGNTGRRYSSYGPKLFDYLSELTDVVAEYDDRIIIFEDYPDHNFSTKEQYLGFYGVNFEVGMPFNFEGIHLKFDAREFSRFVTNFQGMLDPDRHRPVYCFGNHDQSRMINRYGGEDQARIVAMLQLSLPGLPVVYYGDEIGMTDVEISHQQIRDTSAFTLGDDSKSRDPSRTPMRWDATSQNAGFSAVEPWLPVGPNIKSINVETELGQPDSMLALYRRLLHLRSEHELFRSGSFETFGYEDRSVFMFSRRMGDEHVFVVLNFSNKPQKVKLPHSGRVLCCTHPVDYPDITDEGEISLRPHEGAIVECADHPLIY